MMKKCLLKQMALVAVMALTAVGCGPKKTNENVEPHKVTPKMLVIYYSQTTNTKIVAEEIANASMPKQRKSLLFSPMTETLRRLLNAVCRNRKRAFCLKCNL